MSIAPDSEFFAQRPKLNKVKVKASQEIMNWWRTLSPEQRHLYATLHRSSELSKRHFSTKKFPGFNKVDMYTYHTQQHQHHVNSAAHLQQQLTHGRMASKIAAATKAEIDEHQQLAGIHEKIAKHFRNKLV